MLCEVSLSLTEKVSFREELETIDKVRKGVHLEERVRCKSNIKGRGNRL